MRGPDGLRDGNRQDLRRRGWRLIDLAQWIFEEFRVTITKQTLSRELRTMGYRKVSARPRHHAQAEGAIDLVPGRGRIGWKNKITRRWAERGTCPSAAATLGA